MEIKLNNLCCVNTLNEINYTFSEGKITSIIGKSSSGKSIIGYAIMDLVDIDSGNILIDKKASYDKHLLMKKIGYVYQEPWEHFFCETVYDEIAFGLKQFKYKLDKIDKQVKDALKMVGLDERYLNKKISTLSSGEAERVAIASSLVLNPDVLILDEPTVFLDSKVKKDISRLVKMLRDRYSKTVIIMSNDMDFVFDVSDNYLLINNGKIKSSGSISKLIDEDIDDVPNSYKFVRFVRDKYKINLKYTSNIHDLVMDVVDNV